MSTLPIQAKATTGVGKPQADSEGNERIPPDGFGVAALENCCSRASPQGCGHPPTLPRKAILHTNSNAHVNSFTTAGMVSMDTSVVTAKMWEA